MYSENMLTRLLTIGHMALIIFHLQLSACHPLTSGPRYEARGVTTSHRYPTRELAGITVIDTPLVRSAQAFALAHSSSTTYNHVMRSWLFGALMVKNNATLQRTIDLEIQAVSALLHDLGWYVVFISISYVLLMRRALMSQAGTKPHRPLSYPPTDASK